MSFFENQQRLEDFWNAVAPYGLTRDGEYAPALAFDKDGEPMDADNWDAIDFYTPAGDVVGYSYPGEDGPLIG